MQRTHSSYQKIYRPQTTKQARSIPKRNRSAPKITPCQFIPFVNERDHLGKLIKLKQGKTIPLQEFYLTSKGQDKIENKDKRVDQNINKFFRNRCELYQQPKHRISKKALLKISNIPKTATTTIKKSDLVFTQEAESPQNIKLRSVFSCQQKRVQNTTVKRFNSLKIQPIQDISSNCKRKKSHIQHISLKKTASYAANQIRVQTDVNDYHLYPQLSRYQKMQTLEVKMCDTFEDGHMKFITKMKNSKQLAFEVKKGLEKIDGFFFM